MAARKSLVLVLAAAFASLGAEYRTPNFDVSAPTPEIAQQIGQYAEYYRKQKAMLWLGQEMPQWPEPIPLRVTILRNGSSGATEFGFDRGYILSQRMHIEGPLDRLTASVLPHEVTHTVFAYYFRQPLPRWADEGGAVLSEDDIERQPPRSSRPLDPEHAGPGHPAAPAVQPARVPARRDGAVRRGLFGGEFPGGQQQPAGVFELRGPGDARRLGRGRAGELRL